VIVDPGRIRGAGRPASRGHGEATRSSGGAEARPESRGELVEPYTSGSPARSAAAGYGSLLPEQVLHGTGTGLRSGLLVSDRVCRWFGIGTVRGCHTRVPSGALPDKATCRREPKAYRTSELDQARPRDGRSAVGVGAVLNGDDFDLDAGLDDLVDDPVVPSAGTVLTVELEA